MRLPDALFDAVLPLLAEAAARAVMPRFQALRDGEVIEKARGDLVTVADREAEALIEHGLLRLLPGARVVGEEACAADATRLQGLDRGLVWLVDPLDGTSNFVAGRPVFATMAALLVDGEAVGAWVLHPVTGERWRAQRGSGCYRDGVRQQVPPAKPLAEARGAVLSRFMPPGLREHVETRAPQLGACLPGQRCAGVEYPALVTGAQQFALFYRTLPWDHVPGALLLREAGGHVARYDGGAYRAADAASVGLLAAVDEPLWRQVRAALLP